MNKEEADPSSAPGIAINGTPFASEAIRACAHSHLVAELPIQALDVVPIRARLVHERAERRRSSGIPLDTPARSTQLTRAQQPLEYMGEASEDLEVSYSALTIDPVNTRTQLRNYYVDSPLPLSRNSLHIIIIVDQHSFGSSTAPPGVQGSSHFANLTACINTILDHVEAQIVICMGHDWRPVLYYEAVRRRPDFFAGIVGVTVPQAALYQFRSRPALPQPPQSVLLRTRASEIAEG
ncbi:hypothetical protein CONPUDRAFT_165875 [Coniophora puteana RWD-64-598 SS2]|uniref:Uncharacterized protein n=1 Tax=Coniophora puteana (strain RWD-64-598) TaxID=741705 RepID=A0A5M3MMS3_CONPW|nr:uncharacterized protein CONPUDRAFT_165875 [Coniophora puteana RWD-64-598 SS2]EIW80310.1 hypothetical protein CONPUDRAFT_165875 [Coniophora puteana RWD-64-598 SS2]